MPTPMYLIGEWAKSLPLRPLVNSKKILSTTQKTLSSNERNRPAPTLVRDSRFLDELEGRYRELLENDLTQRGEPTKTWKVNGLEDAYWSVKYYDHVLRSDGEITEESESDTNEFHRAILNPLSKLARLIMVQKAAEITGQTDIQCDMLVYKPTVESQKALDDGADKRVAIPDHIFIGSIGDERSRELKLVCIEDKNTAFGSAHGSAVDNRVGHTQSVSLSAGIPPEERVWRQVDTQLAVSKCRFGKLTCIYGATWYFWKTEPNDSTLYVSDMLQFNNRLEPDVYMSHYKLTLLLLLAAIHEASHEVFEPNFPPYQLRPPSTISAKTLKGLISFKHRFVTFALFCWTWLSYGIVQILGMGILDRVGVVYSGSGDACTSLRRDRRNSSATAPFAIPLYIQLARYVGSGTSGNVFRDERLGLAVKVAHHDDEAILAITHEASIYDQLNGLPNLPVPRMYGHFTCDDLHVLLLEWCGRPLATHSFDEISGPQKLALQEAITSLHSVGIHHHDIRPSNVLINEDGLIRLVDFHFAELQCVQGPLCPDKLIFLEPLIQV